MNIKEGAFSALDRPNIEHSPQAGPEFDNDVDEGRSTLHSSATIESHHQFSEASGVAKRFYARLICYIALPILF